MAQIRIEEKKSPNFLPWILGALLLALGIWGISELFDEGDPLKYDLNESVMIEDDPDFPGVELREEVAEVGADLDDYDADFYADEIDSYLTYTTDMEGEMGLDHEFSHAALSRLAAATAAVAEGRDLDESNYEGKMNQVMRLADDITKDPYATDHADKIRMSAMLISEVLEDVDEMTYNSVNSAAISELRSEAQQIKGGTLTLEQKEDVRSFFRSARTVLNEFK